MANLLPETTVRAYFHQNRQSLPYYQHISYFLEIPRMYTRGGTLGCLLGFWPLGHNPAGAMMITESTVSLYQQAIVISLRSPYYLSLFCDQNALKTAKSLPKGKDTSSRR